MSPTSPDPVNPTPSRRLWPRLLCLAGAVLAGLCFFSPTQQVMDVQLDSSNYASYAYFTARGFSFGTDVVPMAGPYGFVPYGDTYSGNLFGKRLALEALTKLILGGLVVWFFLRSARQPVLRWVWLLLLAIMVPPIVDLPYTLAILLSGLFLAENHLGTSRSSLPTCCAVAGYLALLTLFKGTQTMLAAATFGLLFVQSLLTRNFRRLPWILASYAATLVALLLIAGQNPLNLPQYLHGISELASGYNLAMGVDEPKAVFLVGVGTAAFLLLLVGWSLLPRWRNPAALAGGLFLAGFSFISWKHGFVRADGHTYIYFHFALVAVPTILLYLGRTETAVPVSRWQRVFAAGLAVIAFALAFWGNGENSFRRHLWSLQLMPARVAQSWRQLTAPTAAKRQFDALLETKRIFYQLPQFQEIAGKERIDFFGYEQAYLILNRFNYRPRPVGGGTFNAYTPWLRSINVDYLLDESKRPEYFLVSIQTIDEHFTAQDDAGTLLDLLANYRPLESGSGLTIFRAKPGQPQKQTPRLIGTQGFMWNQPVKVPVVRPDELLLVSVQMPPSLGGRLRSFLYKPPAVFMDLKGERINQPNGRRVIPEMFKDPLLLNPVIEDTDDFLALYQTKSGKNAEEFTLKTAGPGCFDPASLMVRFYVVPRPEPAPPVPIRLQHSLVTKESPFMIEATTALLLHYEDLVAQILVPPGRMGYALKGDETIIRFTYGMHPATYNLPTDGMDFFVELVRPGQPAQTIFHRHIFPHAHPEEQGQLKAQLALPPYPPGSKLYLCTGRGPDNNGAWDLGYYTGIEFVHGPYVSDQFPGFATLPSAVTADTCGGYNDHGREVFMLNAPGSMTFDLKGREKTLRFTAGLLSGAYTNGGKTDGVEFVVTLRKPDGSSSTLFHQECKPGENKADQGDQSYVVALPVIAPGAQLVLTITPGPSGSNAWDWTYLASLSIDSPP